MPNTRISTEADVTDEEMAEILRDLEVVWTPRRRVRNEIVRVVEGAVVVCSERTDRERVIPFSAIRRAARATTNGSVARGLHEAVFARAEGDPRSRTAPPFEFAPSRPEPDGAERPREMVDWYRSAREWVDENSDWVKSVDWNRDPAGLTAQQFLAEYAWAVYVSGFKARTVRIKWASLRAAWHDFQPGLIDDEARRNALALIAHKSKTSAILHTARMIAGTEWSRFRESFLANEDSIGRLSWMGPANRRFLARNLRLADNGKPDRWLIRFAERFGYRSVDAALAVIENATGDTPGLADVYVWAYLSEHPSALA